MAKEFPFIKNVGIGLRHVLIHGQVSATMTDTGAGLLTCACSLLNHPLVLLILPHPKLTFGIHLKSVKRKLKRNDLT